MISLFIETPGHNPHLVFQTCCCVPEAPGHRDGSSVANAKLNYRNHQTHQIPEGLNVVCARTDTATAPAAALLVQRRDVFPEEEEDEGEAVYTNYRSRSHSWRRAVRPPDVCEQSGSARSTS